MKNTKTKAKKTKKKVVTKKSLVQAKKTSTAKKTSRKTSQSSRVKGTIKRSLSKKLIAQEIEFSFYAPLAKRVQIAGNFNEWNAGRPKFKKDTNGTWRTKLALSPGRYEYRYLVDGNWENAQSEHEMIDNGMGSLNSILTVS